ncbi:MAG: hypothetical protein HFF69_06410 [Oscillospiraceae bacterium]|jgi:hypothetical protein|nr:hypothetical protein [Oscillospiraceae bacterium]
MSFLLERDTLHGAAGKAFVTVNGQVKELFGAKKIQTQAEIQGTDMKVIGTKKVQNKPGGVKQTGTGTCYYGTPLFVDMLAQYIRTGEMPYFSFQTTNDDKASSVGVQTIAYYNCKLSGTVPVSVLDADADMLTFDFSFTYEDFEVLSRFNEQPAQLGT